MRTTAQCQMTCVALVVFALLLTACSGPEGSSPTPTAALAIPTVTPQAPSTHAPTPASTPTPPATPTASPTLVPTPTASATATSTPTATPSPTPAPTSTPEPTPTVVPLPTATPTATPEPPRAPVIVLDPGHDASSGGALGIEYQLVLQTALATQAVLEAAGYQVLLTRPDNATILRHDPSLLPPNAASMDPGYVEGYAHATRALQLDPDLILSLHYNGSPSPDARGLTVYYCEHGGSQNQQLAELVRDELLVALRSVGYEPPYAQATEDGAIGKVYGHLATLGNVYRAPFELEHNRMPGIPVVLTEPLFLTNASELALIQRPETHQAFALAYLRAINRYFGR